MSPFIEDNNEVNAIAHLWGNQIASEMRAKLSALGVRKTGKLLRAVKSKYHYDFGEIDRISFNVLRYGILTEKGVGRGVGMKNGVRFSTAKSNTGVIKRIAKPWISQSITENSISDLANKIAIVKANAQVKSFKI